MSFQFHKWYFLLPEIGTFLFLKLGTSYNQLPLEHAVAMTLSNLHGKQGFRSHRPRHILEKTGALATSFHLEIEDVNDI